MPLKTHLHWWGFLWDWPWQWVYWTCLGHLHLGQCDISRNGPICAASPKVVEASIMLLLYFYQAIKENLPVWMSLKTHLHWWGFLWEWPWQWLYWPCLGHLGRCNVSRNDPFCAGSEISIGKKPISCLALVFNFKLSYIALLHTHTATFKVQTRPKFHPVS